MNETDLIQLSTSLSNATFYTIPIPNLYLTPYIICPITLGNQQYYFEYYWNNRTSLAYISIYKISNGDIKYYVKNISLKPYIFISDYIKDQDWVGILSFENIDNNFDISYTIKDISEKFQFLYSIPED